MPRLPGCVGGRGVRCRCWSVGEVGGKWVLVCGGKVGEMDVLVYICVSGRCVGEVGGM